MVEGSAVQVPVRVRRFAVYTAGKGSILLSEHLNVKKRNAAISFLFHCELDVAVKPVEVFPGRGRASPARVTR